MLNTVLPPFLLKAEVLQATGVNFKVKNKKISFILPSQGQREIKSNKKKIKAQNTEFPQIYIYI